MTLQDISHGPGWTIWVAFAVFAIIGVILLTGHGADLIAGYNTSSKEEKSKYDEKKLCRIAGAGMVIVALLILIMGLFESVLPASFARIALGLILADVIVTVILMNTKCKK